MTSRNVRPIASAPSLEAMTPSELQDWVRAEVAAQTQLLREQVEVLRQGLEVQRSGLDVLAGQIDHQQRILQLVGTLATDPKDEG